MVSKLTLKQERFCQEYTSNGGNASAAYRAAYDAENMKNETIWVKASNLLKLDKVTVRVNQIQSGLNAIYDIDREFITEKLMFVINQAREKKHGEQVRRATMALARLHGLIPAISSDNQIKKTYNILDSVAINGIPLEFDVSSAN